MKKLIVFIAILLIADITAYPQCTCNYTYSGVNDTLTFTNFSVVSNAHYYWNFGDGSTSYETNPIHVFPESGNYLVMLYAKDTVSNCHTYYEHWILVHKPSGDPCNAFITDSIFNYNGDDYIAVIDSSSNCGIYSSNIDMGPAQNFSFGNWIGVAEGFASLFVSRVQYYTHDSINGHALRREYYKTTPYGYSSSLNYDTCSSNFEFYIDYQATGAMVNMTAMDKSGVDTFWVTGFGNGIPIAAHAASYFYPYVTYDRYFPWLIYYTKTDVTNGCRVEGIQEILIRNPHYTDPPGCTINLPLQNQTVNVGSDGQFIISTDPKAAKQWQQDAGFGYVNLTNAGPYGGVKTDTLTIANVSIYMNNFFYRCVVSDNSSYCHNTSLPAVLTVHPVGIDEKELNGALQVYPSISNGIFNIKPGDGNSLKQISIFDATGRVVFVSMKNSSEINLGNFSNGVYFYAIEDSRKRVFRGKIMKE